MSRRSNHSFGIAAALALALVALGGGLTACAQSAPATPAVTGPVRTGSVPTLAVNPSLDPAAVAAIRGWFDAANAGDLEKAATYFATGARVGTNPSRLVTTGSMADVVAFLRETDGCQTTIGSIRQDAATIWVEAAISGAKCPFLQAGETSHGILIPVLVVNGRITCTCPAASGSLVAPEGYTG